MAGEEPPYLAVGTDVSAKYKGAFCEAKVKKVNRSVKCKVTFKNNLGIVIVSDDNVKGTLRVGAHVEAKHPDKNQFFEAVINKLNDHSQYTVVFDDGDETTLRRNSLCLKSGRHFAESETLDQLPLTHPEHFGTPVIGSKGRKRRSLNRSTNDEGSSDDDLPPKKKETKQREPDPDIGKVVCVELGDKKKPKDNWFPALVVSPSAQESVKVNSDDYLVRSFKDGKYFGVAKKDTRQFTREIGSKVDNNTLKTAVEKASQYTDRDELPPHWDRDILFGNNDVSEDGDSNEDSDSDSSDDEPSEEKDRFVAQLYKFMDDRGTPINKAPTVSNRDLNLCKLFKVVQKMGGYNRVTNHMQWKTVYTKMGLPGYNTSSSHQIKQAYKKYLHSFEDFYRKLGCTMGTSTRSGRMRHRSGRSFLLIRDRDREFKAAGRRKQENKKKYEKNNKDEETSKNEESKDENKSKSEKPDSEPFVGNDSNDHEQQQEKGKVKEDKKTKIKKEKFLEKKSKIDKEEKHIKIKGRKKSVKEEDNGEEGKNQDSSYGSEVYTDIDINVGDKVKVKYGKGRHQKIYEAKVLEVEEEDGDKHFYVHYTGWNMRYDEWVKRHRIVENLSQKARKGRSAGSPKNTTVKQSGAKRGRPPSVFGKTNLPVSKKSPIASVSPRSRSTRSDKNSLADSPFVNGLEPRKRMRKSSGHTDHSNDCSKESHDENSDDDSDDSRPTSVEVKQESSVNLNDSEFSELVQNEDPNFESFNSDTPDLFSKPAKKGRKSKKATEEFLNVEDDDGDGDIEDGDEEEEEENYDNEIGNDNHEKQNLKSKLATDSSKKVRKTIKKEKREEEIVESKRKRRTKKSKDSSDNDSKSDSSKEATFKHGSDENNDEGSEDLEEDLQLNIDSTPVDSSSKKSDDENHDEKEYDRGLKVKKKGKQKIKKEDTSSVSLNTSIDNENDMEDDNNSDNCNIHATDMEKFDKEEIDKEIKTEPEVPSHSSSLSSQESYEPSDSKEETESDDQGFKTSDVVEESKTEENASEEVKAAADAVEENSEPSMSYCFPENNEVDNECNVSEENSEKNDDQEECSAPILVCSSVSEVRDFSDSEPAVSSLEKYSLSSDEGRDKELDPPEKIMLIEEKAEDTEDDLEHKVKRNRKKTKIKKENEDELTELSEAESESKKTKPRLGKPPKAKRLKLPFNNSETDFKSSEPVISGHCEAFKPNEHEKEKDQVPTGDAIANNSVQNEASSVVNVTFASEQNCNISAIDGSLKFTELVPSSNHSGTYVPGESSESAVQAQPLFTYDDHREKGKEREKKHHKPEIQTDKREVTMLLEQSSKGLSPGTVYEEKISQGRKELLFKWEEKAADAELVKTEDLKKKVKDDEKKKTEEKKTKDEEKKPKEAKQKKSKEKKSKSKRDDDKESSKDSDKKDGERTKKKESKKKRDAEKRKLEKNESDMESVENSEVFRKKEKKRKSKQEDRKKDGETVKKKSKKKGLKEYEKLSDEDLKEMKESKKTGKKSDKLGKSKKKKDKSKKDSLSDDHEGGKVKSDKEHGKKTEKRLKAESVKQTIEKPVVSIKEEPEYDDVTNLLLCREDVPMSPVAGDNQACKQELELTIPNLVPDNQFDVRTSEDSATLPVANSTTYNPVSVAIGEGESSSQSFFKNDQESSVVLDNTPPTTPESAISTMSGSLHECDSISPGRDEESTKSGQESINYMDLEHYNDMSRLVCHEHVDFAQSEAALVLGSLGVQAVEKRQPLMPCTTTITTKRSRPDFEELTPKKKKKSRRRSHSTSEVGKNMNSPRHKHAPCKLSKATASDSDETLPSDQVPNSFHSQQSHSSINNNSSSNISSSSSYTSSDREGGIMAPSLNSPKASKFNFFVELEDYMNGTERIAILQEKLAELRKTYMALKAEVACIDRRRKKLRKKEKDGASTTSNAVEVEFS